MSTVAKATDRIGSGWLSFSGLMILLLGVFNVVEAIFAIVNDRYAAYATSTGGELYLFNLHTWGWLHLILGAVLIAVGAGILAGQEWARGAGIGLAGATALLQMLYLPVYPFWSIVNIALCILVIYGLVVPPRGSIAE
ncbi:hypothetical protein ACFQY4_41480 [Catellatospora bangladeshensis]|jgi:hypothetical protein|uniref:DUF7144 domain-containing protein n=1 Tax=Catellatospora bangladeshensis TaxID=310355 RepID=A0A8J3JG03_9ACTN|nr:MULTISPECIES: hypothetical protein [Catellatospora]BCJ72557.1 hypothetical protein CS0771_21010 [Catellatospora sp. IY07-71]GIF79807.1 hypothetical protein Cba03nite_11560 [Catellatospora bangladeshensis]